MLDHEDRVGLADLVLGRAGQRDLAGHLPDGAARHPPGPRPRRGVGVQPPPRNLLDLLEQLRVDALLVDQVAGRVRAGHHLPAELGDLLDRIDRHVARSRHHHPAPLQGQAAGLEHLGHEDGAPVPGRLGPHRRAAPPQALAGQRARLVAVGDPLVLAEQVADLARADPDVPGGDVGVGAEVAVQLGHEALAEPHHLPLGAALGVEIRAALATADLHAGQAVLEDLLEAQEFHDPQVHRRVEPKAALVGPERTGELHPERSVDLNVTVVVLPGDLEDHLALRLAQPLQNPRLRVLRPLGHHRTETAQHLEHGLMELGLSRVAADDIRIDWRELLG